MLAVRRKIVIHSIPRRQPAPEKNRIGRRPVKRCVERQRIAPDVCDEYSLSSAAQEISDGRKQPSSDALLPYARIDNQLTQMHGRPDHERRPSRRSLVLTTLERLLLPQHSDRIRARGAPGRDIAGSKRHNA